MLIISFFPLLICHQWNNKAPSVSLTWGTQRWLWKISSARVGSTKTACRLWYWVLGFFPSGYATTSLWVARKLDLLIPKIPICFLECYQCLHIFFELSIEVEGWSLKIISKALQQAWCGTVQPCWIKNYNHSLIPTLYTCHHLL